MVTGLLTTSCDTDNVAELYNAQQETWPCRPQP